MQKKIQKLTWATGITAEIVKFLCELIGSFGDPPLQEYIIIQEFIFPCIRIFYFVGLVYLLICFAFEFFPNKWETAKNLAILVISIFHLTGIVIVFSLYQIFDQGLGLYLILFLPLMILDLILIWLTLPSLNTFIKSRFQQSI